uniref:Uncharacterized protein n=1 Tax=Trichinella nativa TaxID=6335 RepID=A0A0V1KGU1_9BILA
MWLLRCELGTCRRAHCGTIGEKVAPIDNRLRRVSW